MKYLKILAIIYPMMMIFTFGHAAKTFQKEAVADCQLRHEQEPRRTCGLLDLNYRSETMFFSLLWPYYWSQILWEKP